MLHLVPLQQEALIDQGLMTDWSACPKACGLEVIQRRLLLGLTPLASVFGQMNLVDPCRATCVSQAGP